MCPLLGGTLHDQNTYLARDGGTVRRVLEMQYSVVVNINIARVVGELVWGDMTKLESLRGTEQSLPLRASSNIKTHLASTFALYITESERLRNRIRVHDR